MTHKRDSSLFTSAYRAEKFLARVDLILATAQAIMREQGVAALSMHELARRLNLRAPSLYNYFSNKLELYDALFRLGYQRYAEMTEAATRQDTVWPDFVRHSCESYLSFAIQYPELYQLCFERPVPGFTPSSESLKVSQTLLAQANQQVSRFKPQIASELSPAQITDLVIALMHGITAMHLANEPDLPAGSGRFGALILPAVELLEKAWSVPA